jgi:K+-transporting ATPase ATPase C chain
MLTLFRPVLVMTLGMTVLTGLAYPLAMTGIAQAIAPEAATGSLIESGGRIVGSALIGQDFTGAGYLHPRASASGYGAMPSGASNLGPTSATLAADVATRRAAWEAANGGPAPVDAVTMSGSGLDPHISAENARGQAARIAAERGIPLEQVLGIIAARTEGRWLGLYGEPRVNVLLTNLALDEAAPPRPAVGN